LLPALLAVSALLGAAGEAPQPRARPQPSPPPAAPQPAKPDGPIDMRRAVPAKDIARLPSTEAQYRQIKRAIDSQKPVLAGVKKNSEALERQTYDLKRKLVTTASEVGRLEEENIRLGTAISRLESENDGLTKSFSSDRIAATRLLAVLERLQHDMPPAMILNSDDVMAAIRGTMLMGAALPDIYGRAAMLARKIERLRVVRHALVARRTAAAANAAGLAKARIEMAQLLVVKARQAAAAAAQYGDLKRNLDQAAQKAENLQMLLDKVAALRGAPAAKEVVTIAAQGGGAKAPAGAVPKRGALRRPVAGEATPGGLDGVGGERAPGITYTTIGEAQVVSPADADVLFAGTYHKNGQVLILEIANGYDVVLAGLDRLDVRPGDRVLAGEPVGKMPGGASGPVKLYFELRHDGRGMNPAPFVGSGTEKARKS
jgi:murein hydrolase activator